MLQQICNDYLPCPFRQGAGYAHVTGGVYRVYRRECHVKFVNAHTVRDVIRQANGHSSSDERPSAFFRGKRFFRFFSTVFIPCLRLVDFVQDAHHLVTLLTYIACVLIFGLIMFFSGCKE